VTFGFAYQISGGPGGPLGRPLTVTSDGSGHHAHFGGGSISAPYGGIPTAEFSGATGSPLSLDTCNEVPLSEAAGI